MNIQEILPQITWKSPWSLKSDHYRDVLIATNKHDLTDWMISFGSLNPIDNFEDYELKIGKDIVEKSEVLAVGLFEDYGTMLEY